MALANDTSLKAFWLVVIFCSVMPLRVIADDRTTLGRIGPSGPLYGPEHSSSYILKLPNSYGLYDHTKPVDGQYEGIGSYPGDRRYDAFDRKYTITIKTVQQASDPRDNADSLEVGWASKLISAPPNDGTSYDNINYVVTDAYSNGQFIWGNMAYKDEKGNTVIRCPFMALRCKKGTDDGLLLLGRYEGQVFLKKAQ
jgi:hypothetical protein